MTVWEGGEGGSGDEGEAGRVTTGTGGKQAVRPPCKFWRIRHSSSAVLSIFLSASMIAGRKEGRMLFRRGETVSSFLPPPFRSSSHFAAAL